MAKAALRLAGQYGRVPPDSHRPKMPSVRPGPKPLRTGFRRLSLAQRVAVTRERLLWNRRARNWDSEGSTGLTKVVEAVLAACRPSPTTVAVDLGCGSGQVTMPLAARCARVLAVDVSASFIERLESKAVEAGVDNIQVVTTPIETLDLPAGSVDPVVSNYALHHLRDRDKALVMERAYHWLRPSGCLVIGDMMFGRGSEASDRKPLTTSRWEALVRSAGFTAVRTERVVSEACVLTAVKPGP